MKQNSIQRCGRLEHYSYPPLVHQQFQSAEQLVVQTPLHIDCTRLALERNPRPKCLARLHVRVRRTIFLRLPFPISSDFPHVVLGCLSCSGTPFALGST